MDNVRGRFLGLPHGICSLCILTYCNLSYFLLWFWRQDFGSDYISSWSLLIFYFRYVKRHFIKNNLLLFYLFNYILKTIQLHKSAASYKNPIFALSEKGPYQLHVNPTADKCLCFCYIDTIPLLSKSEISSVKLYSEVFHLV